MKTKLSELRLADGRPVHHALLTGQTVTPEAENNAWLNVLTLHKIHPEAAATCHGKSAMEALQILLGIGREEIDVYPA